MLSRTYELSLSKDYVAHWGMLEAIRELLQNALDSESAFEWEFEGDTLQLHSRNSILEPRTLLLGVTAKSDDPDTIGNFGEGYKIAMLVLTRLGYNVEILNGKNTWVPEFRLNRKYECEMLYVISTHATIMNDGITFKVSGLTENDIEHIRDICLPLQDEIGEVKQTKYGRILINKPGKLYVGGLFICNTELKFGYDILPHYIRLERDRQTVDNWDLKVITRDMWFDTDDMDYVATLIEAGYDDVEHASWSCPEVVKEACYNHFIKENPKSIIATSQEELDTLIKKGMEKVVVVRRGYGSIINSYKSYGSHVAKIEPTLTPKQELEKWFKEHKYHMHAKSQKAFNVILTKSNNWRK